MTSSADIYVNEVQPKKEINLIQQIEYCDIIIVKALRVKEKALSTVYITSD